MKQYLDQFVEIIRVDLNIPADVEIDLIKKQFGPCVYGRTNYFEITLTVGETYRHADILYKNVNDFNELLKTLMHEMKHVQQFVSKRLVIDGTGTFWLGNPILMPRISKNGMPTKEYLEAPWEIEAREYEGRYESILDRFHRCWSTVGSIGGVTLRKFSMKG